MSDVGLYVAQANKLPTQANKLPTQANKISSNTNTLVAPPVTKDNSSSTIAATSIVINLVLVFLGVFCFSKIKKKAELVLEYDFSEIKSNISSFDQLKDIWLTHVMTPPSNEKEERYGLVLMEFEKFSVIAVEIGMSNEYEDFYKEINCSYFFPRQKLNDTQREIAHKKFSDFKKKLKGHLLKKMK